MRESKVVRQAAPPWREFINGTVCTEPGARQSEAADCDINRIVAQFYRTGLLPEGFTTGVFADVSEISDYRSALERMQLAQEEFMKLPPQLRARFDNDPLSFVEFAANPANEAEMVAMGLLEARKPPEGAAARAAGGEAPK